MDKGNQVSHCQKRVINTEREKTGMNPVELGWH